jgi:hypothetical protein
MRNKQCARCVAHVGPATHGCPACGRGSLKGELGMFTLLGILLLGIGLAAGLIPLNLSPLETVAAPTQAALPAAPEKPKTFRRHRGPSTHLPAVPAMGGQPYVEARSIPADAPCSSSDSSTASRRLREQTVDDRSRLRMGGCGSSKGYRSAF